MFKQNIKAAKACNAGKRWKTTIGLISKSNFACAAHFSCTFLSRCFARLQRETSRNFLVTRFVEEMSYMFLFTFFHCRYFHLALVAASISHFVNATTKFPSCSSNKKCLLGFFISRSKSLSPFFSLSFAGLLPTFSFLCLSLALYSKFVDMTIYLSLIL